MKVLQPVGSAAASGSAGGTTASRNRSGNYFRNKTTPVNPNTALQSAQRSRFSQLIAAWSDLTQAQRDGWGVYANAIPKNDVFGQPIVLPGRLVFIGNNALRVQAGLSIVTAAPTELTIPGLTAPVVTATAGDPLSVAFTNTDSWANEVGGALLLFTAPPKGATRNYCRGPYRYGGKIAGAATAPTSPGTITAGFTYTENQKVFWKAVALTADGRVSADAYGFCVCGA